MASSKNTTSPREGPRCNASGESLTEANDGEQLSSSSFAPVCPVYTRGATNAKKNGGRKKEKKTTTRSRSSCSESAESSVADAAEQTGDRSQPEAAGEGPPQMAELPSVVLERTNYEKFWRKRNRSRDGAATGSEGSSTEMPPPKVASARRGRVATSVVPAPTASRSQYLALRRAEGELQAEEEVEEIALRLRTTRESIDSLSVADLTRRSCDVAAIFSKVATKSRNIKGTFVRAMREASDEQRAIMDSIAGRYDQLSERCESLSSELAALRAEVALLRGRAAEVRSADEPPPSEDSR